MLALVIAVIVVAAFLAGRAAARRGEGFASQRAHEVRDAAERVFDSNPNSYELYKKNVEGADPVLFADTRRLWREGRLTADNVEGAL